jgi:hypothetical protein
MLPRCTVAAALLGCILHTAFADDAPATPEPSAANLREIAALKRGIRSRLQQKTGSRQQPTVPPSPTKPYDYYRCLTDYEAAKGDQKKLYQAIERHLALAGELLAQGREPDVRKSGVGVCYYAARCASERLKDRALAVDICRAWLVPNINVADERHWKLISRNTIAQTSTMIFLDAREFSLAESTAKLWMEQAHNRNSADSARLKLAQSLDAQEKTSEAIAVLEQIEDQASLSGAKKMIPVLREKIESAKAKQTTAVNNEVKK